MALLLSCAPSDLPDLRFFAMADEGALFLPKLCNYCLRDLSACAPSLRLSSPLCSPSPFQETTTAAIAPVHVATEAPIGTPVVKLPSGINYPSRNSFQLDNIPPLVRLPEIPIPDGQSPLVDSPLGLVVSDPQPAGPQRACLDKLRETVQFFLLR